MRNKAATEDIIEKLWHEHRKKYKTSISHYEFREIYKLVIAPQYEDWKCRDEQLDQIAKGLITNGNKKA